MRRRPREARCATMHKYEGKINENETEAQVLQCINMREN